MSLHLLIWNLIAAAIVLAGASAFADPPVVDPGEELGNYLTHHGYGVMQLDVDRNNDQVVSVQIDGRWARLLVDTGSEFTCLSHSCARNLALKVVPTRVVAAGVGGVVKNVGVAEVKSFKLNGYEINRSNIVFVQPAEGDTPRDGLFGIDFMRMNAVLLPVGGNFLFFKPGSTPVADVSPYLQAMGYQAVPVTVGKGCLRIAGRLDGHAFSAVVDCGDSYTTFDQEFVVKLGIHLRSTVVRVVGVDGRQLPLSIFNAHDLAFGPMNFGSMESSAASGTLASNFQAQALLGYDLLAAHGTIIDLGHDVLWMK